MRLRCSNEIMDFSKFGSKVCRFPKIAVSTNLNCLVYGNDHQDLTHTHTHSNARVFDTPADLFHRVFAKLLTPQLLDRQTDFKAVRQYI